jgi:hypothetical protein
MSASSFWLALADKADLAVEYVRSRNAAQVRYLVGYSEPDAPGSDLLIHHAGLLEMQSGLLISKSAARRDFSKATVHLEAQHERSLVNARHELVVAKGVWEQGLAGQNQAHTTVTKPSLDPAGDRAAAATTAGRVSDPQSAWHPDSKCMAP